MEFTLTFQIRYKLSTTLFLSQASTNGYQRGPAIRKGDYDADNDGNAPPYPGVIIEEMIDSASQIGSPDDNKCVTKMDHAEVSLKLLFFMIVIIF